MNSVEIMGRLTKDPALFGAGEKRIAKYTLAIDRRKDGADFIPCVQFGKGADFAEKYLHKGQKIAVTGALSSGSYEKDGEKRYTLDVIVYNVDFCEKKTEEVDISDVLEAIPFD